MTELIWQPRWSEVRAHHLDWWRGQGLVLWCSAPAAAPHQALDPPPPPADLDQRWYGPAWRVRAAQHGLAHTYFGGDSFPLLTACSGAGDLAAYLGCALRLSPETVWYEPRPEAEPPLLLDRANRYLQAHLELTRLAAAECHGRYAIGLPDLVENLDIHAALRGPTAAMIDLAERPEWVEERLWRLNEIYFEVFDLFRDAIGDPEGGNGFCFDIWAPGRTAKVQCDSAAMISPAMFRRFVVPPLTAQCQWLDYALFHLDGEDCLCHLEALLAIEPLAAIEWTPRRISVGESGGSPQFYDLYRRILAAGKSVQAVGVGYDEVLPLLDAVGGRGMYIQTWAENAERADRLAQRVDAYR